MTYVIEHKLAHREFGVPKSLQGGMDVVSCSAQGELLVRHPGKIIIKQRAHYLRRTYIGQHDDSPDGHDDGRLNRGAWHTQDTLLPLHFEIFTPDGLLFTPDHVTIADLHRFRDLRGVSQGVWRYRMRGRKEYMHLPELQKIESGEGDFSIGIEETVTSKSAPPLVDTQMRARKGKFEFDLYRVGEFVATARAGRVWTPFFNGRTLKLRDPDGELVASGVGRIKVPITLRMLDKSRDAAGAVRRWSLEVIGGGAGLSRSTTSVHATVLGQMRISKQVIEDRFAMLLGAQGEKLEMWGENDEQDGKNDIVMRLKIKDCVLAETLNMYKFLKKRIDKVPQEPDIDTDQIKIETDKVYTMYRRSRDLPAEAHISLYDLRAKALKIKLINAQHGNNAARPALRVDVDVPGHAEVKIGGFPVASAQARDGHLWIEASFLVTDEGTLRFGILMDGPIGGIVDLDVKTVADIVLTITTLGIGTLVVEALVEAVEELADILIPEAIQKLINEMMEKTPSVLASLNGDHFTFRDVRMEGDDLVFEYIAPTEVEPKPSEGYAPIMGRLIMAEAATGYVMRPRSLGDTWTADNLAKIDHIVVVMMENRSFDHVLGYRAQLPGVVSDGLTPELIEFVRSMPEFEYQVEGESEPRKIQYDIPYLGDPACPIPPNALGLKTRFPRQVGHKLPAVTTQLSERIEGPGGRWINSPKGFLEDFKADGADIDRVHVLGYYAATDLPFYHYLSENYAYSERYFCSHAGPTLPNRMFWLTGDLQYDRKGEAIIDNNSGDNIALSRMPSIADVLTRKGVSWRVYESFPSVAMLRMFARYAGDNANIRPISELAQHVAAGDLSALTIVEPAMHHAPRSDDHPIADMYDGQRFLKSVYDTLRSNEALWRKTMIIVSYDEHGGFYDHVIPPWADGRTHRPRLAENPDVAGPGGASTDPLLAVPYGVRVPAFVVSPWVPAGKGPDIVLDHCSMLKTVLARFCPESKPFMSDRVAHSRSFDAFLSAVTPRLDVPAPPELGDPGWPSEPGVTTPCISAEALESGDVEYHDLTGHFARMLGR